MQASGFVSSFQMLFIVLVILLIVFTILRLLAIKQYRLKRKGEAEDSILVSLGDMLSNTHMSLFDVIYLGIFIVTQSIGYSYLDLLAGYENLILPLLIFVVVLILVSVIFLFHTVKGRAYRRTERILSDHQRIGLEDLIIQKHLAELLHESECDDFTRAEIARVSLENLKKKENKTGDAVRQMMERPEKLRDIERMKSPPSRWKSFRGSLLVLVVFTVILLHFAYRSITGALSQIDLFMNVLPFIFLFTFVLIITLIHETNKAEKERRKALFGI